MAKLVLLDTNVLGIAVNPKALVNSGVLLWLKRLIRDGHQPIVPEIADYELRRELIRLQSERAIRGLDRLSHVLTYLAIDTVTLRRAAALWAQSRTQGRPLAHQHSLDGDVILCAQAQLLSESNPQDEVIVATTNLDHIRRFADANEWQEI